MSLGRTLHADLLDAVRVVASGEALLSPKATQSLITRFLDSPEPIPLPAPSQLDALTDRERETLALVSAGLLGSHRQTAQQSGTGRENCQGERDEEGADKLPAKRPTAGREDGQRSFSIQLGRHQRRNPGQHRSQFFLGMASGVSGCRVHLGRPQETAAARKFAGGATPGAGSTTSGVEFFSHNS